MDLKLAATLYMILISLLNIFLWRWFSHEKNSVAAAEQGIQTEAEVVKSGLENFGRSYAYYVVYRYSTAGGKFYTQRQNISEAHFRLLGTHVQIKYASSNPRISRLTGKDADYVTLKSAKVFVFLGTLIWVIGMIFTIVFYWGIR
ncbi:MAG: DUF3592 domain-containing protein [Anaerolineae bacterium]|nr:DUF3592 domain-containing protein [Anaerolineae bacterium]